MLAHAPLLSGLAFPTSITLDEQDRLYIAESGLGADGRPGRGRIVTRNAHGGLDVVAEGLRAPVTGITCHRGGLYVSEGGRPGRISRVDLRSHARTTVLDNLPSRGDYHTDTPIVIDDWLYFGQGAATNAGVVSWDPLTMPWVSGHDLAHDIPGMEIELAPQGDGDTSAFHAHGMRCEGARLSAQLPCTSAVMRCRLDGSDLQLVAWGFRNPFGIGQDASGRVLVIDLGMNDRGTRAIGNGQSSLHELTPGKWYGFPDYNGGVPVTDPALRSNRAGAKPVRFLLANHDRLGPPAQPLFRFPIHCGPTQFVPDPGSDTALLVTLFGDKRPLTGAPGPKSGRKLARLDHGAQTLTDLDTPRFQRPIDLACSGDRKELFVVDFGDYEIDRAGRMISGGASGAIWQLRAATLGAQSSLTSQRTP